jgi:hypothetical protein
MLQRNVASFASSLLGKHSFSELKQFVKKPFFGVFESRACYHTESPSSEPGYLMIEEHDHRELGHRKNSYSLPSPASMKHFAKLQLQNQEEPLLRSFLMLKYRNSPAARASSLAQVVFSLAGNVLKHRKKKMNKHKFKKRLRLQRKKAPKNQPIKYVKYSKR